MDISTLETFLGAIAKASFLSKHLEKLDRNGEIVMTEYSVLTSSSVYLLSLYAEILVLNSSRLDSVLDEFSKYIVRMVALGDKKGTIIKMGIVKVIRILGVIIAEVRIMTVIFYACK